MTPSVPLSGIADELPTHHTSVRQKESDHHSRRHRQVFSHQGAPRRRRRVADLQFPVSSAPALADDRRMLVVVFACNLVPSGTAH
jgi:hypothetical protein